MAMATDDRPRSLRELLTSERCVVCNRETDIDRHDQIVLMDPVSESSIPDDFDPEDVGGAIADALRHYGSRADHALADAYERGQTIVLHGDCYGQSHLDDLLWDEAEWVGGDDGE